MRARSVARTDVFRVRTREAGRASRAGGKWKAIEAQFAFSLGGTSGSQKAFQRELAGKWLFHALDMGF